MSRAHLSWWERLFIDAEKPFFPFGKWTGLARGAIVPFVSAGIIYGYWKMSYDKYPMFRRMGIYDDADGSKSFAVYNHSEVPVRIDRIEVRMNPKTVQEPSWVKHFGRHYLPLDLAWDTYGDPRCTAAVARAHERYLLNPGESLPLIALENDQCAESAQFFFKHAEKVRLTYWEWPEVLCKEVIKNPGVWDSKKTYLAKAAKAKAAKQSLEDSRLETRQSLRELTTGKKLPDTKYAPWIFEDPRSFLPEKQAV